ncbi:MAG: aldehyde dehydrogenase family protein [Phycisphaerales bacterium]
MSIGPAADLINGRWISLGTTTPTLASRSPTDPTRIIWAGTPRVAHVDQAVAAARAALPAWSSWPRERRFAVLRRFADLCKARADAIASAITDEVGKPLWDSAAEAAALHAKVEITLDESGPLRRVSDFELDAGTGRRGLCWFRPHGVMAVLGPFNFPAHLPNGHVVPALAMGNTIVFKPSDKAPAVGQLLTELLLEALDAERAPPGVVNLVHGGADVAATLSNHDDLDGILFTGSFAVGRRIMEANLDRPGRLLALEMGGNNAAIVLPDADVRQAAIECARSAFITTGQRCTCTRRLIVHEAVADRLIPLLAKIASNLIVGDPRSPHPVFMGPIISATARDSVLAFQARAVASGAEAISAARALDRPGQFLSPGILLVDRFTLDESAPGGDTEVFGPLLRLSIADSLYDSLAQANATRFGLAASIFTRDTAVIERFRRDVRAGCVNTNTGTAGASSKLPFGGLGLSGNHRPAGAFSLDYCAYPVAGLVEPGSAAQIPPGMHVDEAWLR